MNRNTWQVFTAIILAAGIISACAVPDRKNLSKEEIQELLGKCAQPRFTQKAPDEYYSLTNPLQPTAKNLKDGEYYFQRGIKPVPCASCHGTTGDGLGRMAHMFNPPPRNFTCINTIKGVSDGQLFWIIKFGSPDTSMPAFGKKLTDNQIWQVILYVRDQSLGPPPT
jgi:mono/diheme cytochrome c family protein